MAIELVLKNWCDACLAADTNTPGETINVPAMFGAPAFDVEACEEHAAPLREAVANLRALGRSPGKTARPGPVSASKGASSASGDPRKSDQRPGTGGACPECGHVTNTRASLRAHLRKQHDKSLADVGLAVAQYVCPDCGGKFDAGQGFAAHLRQQHGKSMDDALAAGARAKESA